VLECSIDEKVKAVNRMLFDLGSGTQLPNFGDLSEKINFHGQQIEDLKGVIKDLRENYAKTMKESIASGVSVALAKLKAANPSIHLGVVEEDFDCSDDEATRLLEEVKPLGNKVAEEMEAVSPTRSDQSGGSDK